MGGLEFYEEYTPALQMPALYAGRVRTTKHLLPCRHRHSRISAKATYSSRSPGRGWVPTPLMMVMVLLLLLGCAPASMRSIDGGRGVLLSCVVETRLVLVDDGSEVRLAWA